MRVPLAAALLMLAGFAGGCGGTDDREAGERELGAVTVPSGWSASDVEYRPAGMQRRYDEWTVVYRNLDADEAAARSSYSDALRVAGWAGCGTGVVHTDLVQGDLCKGRYEIVLFARLSRACVPATLASCAELTVTLYKVD